MRFRIKIYERTQVNSNEKKAQNDRWVNILFYNSIAFVYCGSENSACIVEAEAVIYIFN